MYQFSSSRKRKIYKSIHISKIKMSKDTKYYRLSVASREFGRGPIKGTYEIYLQADGKIKEGNYFAYSGGCVPIDWGSGSLKDSKGGVKLSEITKKEYEHFIKGARGN